jgi:DNA-binding NarL/FixJ family response regulator
VDLSLPRTQNLDWLKRLHESCPTAKLILLSVHDQPSVCHSAMAAGADGFVLKRTIASELLPAVDAVLSGQHYVAKDVAKFAESPTITITANPPRRTTTPEPAIARHSNQNSVGVTSLCKCQ